MIQAVGRPLRPHPGMEKAVLIDCAGWYEEFGHPLNRRNFNKKKPETKELQKKLNEDEAETKFVECHECKAEMLTSDLRVETDEDDNGITVTKYCINCGSIVAESYVEKKAVKKIKKIKYKKPVKDKKMKAFLIHISDEMGYQPGWAYYKMKLYKDHKEQMSAIYRKYRNSEIVLSTAVANIRRLES